MQKSNRRKYLNLIHHLSLYMKEGTPFPAFPQATLNIYLFVRARRFVINDAGGVKFLRHFRNILSPDYSIHNF
jgi:hypothetical protein